MVEKRKHVTLTIQQKLDIIKRLEKGDNRNKIMEEYNIGSSTIYDIKKNKDQLLKFTSQAITVKDIQCRQTLKKPKLDELDEILYKWFCAKRSEGKPVTGPMVMGKGKQLREDLGIAETDCMFSDGWLHRFKNRHGIRKLDVAGELRSADRDAAEEYKAIFDSLVKDDNLTACQIYNADETGLLWRCLPNSTLAAEGEKCAKGFKKNKDRLTVLLCGNASGDHMLTPFVIGKSKTPRPLKAIKNLPVVYRAQANAWMSSDLFKDWFFHHFVPSVKDNCIKKHGLPEDSKVVLLLDNCRAHPSASELVSGHIFTMYLPPNVTSLLQPMDQGVIQNFKTHYRATFLQSLITSDCMVIDFQKKFNIKDAIFGIALAWDKVKPTTLQKSWRKLWPKAYIEEDSAAIALNEPVVDLVKKCYHNEIRELPEQEVLDWIDIDSGEPVVEEITDELLIESVLGPQPELQPVDAESDDEEGPDDNSTPPPTWSEASAAIDTFIRFAECNKSYNASELVNLCIVRNEFLKKKCDSKKQRDIRSYFK
jgi:hypothetical protein